MSGRAPAGPRAPKLPSPPHAPAPARLRGAPRLPRVSGAPQKQPWEVAPPWFRRNHPAAPIDEWAIYWSLTTTYKLAEALPRAGTPPVRNPVGRFLYQHPIPVPGLNQSGRNRADMWVLPPIGAVDPTHGKGLIINPISAFTHPDPAKDRRERALLGQYGYLEIYIEFLDCLRDPDYFTGQALRGIDLSTRRGQMVLPKRAYAQVPTLDANGWQVVYQGDGKRRWRRHWLGLALPVATASVIVAAAALPVGVATQAAVDIATAMRFPGNAWAFAGSVEGGEASTSLSFTVGTVDGTNLSTKAATMDLFAELVER